MLSIVGTTHKFRCLAIQACRYIRKGMASKALSRRFRAGLAIAVICSTSLVVASSRFKSPFATNQDSSKQENNRESAERLMAEAEKLGAENTARAREVALEKLNRALSLWQVENDLRGQAKAYAGIAEIYQVNGDSKKAQTAASHALQLFHDVSDPAGEALMLNGLGELGVDLGDVQSSLDYFNRALQIYRQTGDQKGQGSVLNNIGMAYDELGEPRSAMDFLEQSLVFRRSSGDLLGEASTLSNIGSVHDSLGELHAALDNYQLALPLFRAAKNLRREALILNNIGYAWANLGELQKALEFYSDALPIRRAVGDRRGEAISLSNIGSTYHRLGDDDRAIEVLNRSLALFQSIQDIAGESRTLNNLANIHLALGETQSALDDYNRILEAERARKDKRAEGSTLRDVGYAQYMLQNYPQAIVYLKQALQIAHEVESPSDEASALQKLGLVYAAVGQLDDAAENYKQSLNLFRRIGGAEKQAMVLYSSSLTELKRGNLEAALSQIETVTALTESLRGKFASEELRRSLSAERQQHYDTNVDILMKMHDRDPKRDFDAKALQIHELARARGLVDLLVEARADIRQGGDPKILEAERKLHQQLDEKERYRMSLLKAKGKEKQQQAVEQEIDALLRDLNDTEAEIRLKSPHYAELTQPRALDLHDIQTKILDSDTVLLEYGLGHAQSYLWYVDQGTKTAFTLPDRKVIEEATRHFYEQLSAKSQFMASRTSETRIGGASAVENDYRRSAIALGRMLLGPLGGRLQNKRLLIVSDGALQYLPFGALSEPLFGATTRPGEAYRPLVRDHEIISVPSLSALALLLSESTARGRAPKTVAVLADPVFAPDDPRLSLAKRLQQTPNTAVAVAGSKPPSIFQKSSREVGFGDFRRLRFSREEAEGITSLVSKKEGLLALDFSASRSTALNPELGEYRFLHFATHGIVNSKHPELSGLVLSLVDENGQPRDGFLRLHEIYNLKLKADLVVLSGCQTALGKEIRGEGIVALTRGFMYAGSPRIVASLWDVDDRATAELMKRFYRQMLVGGMKPSAALRAAQNSLMAERGWESPYYWAGFTFQGDWR